MTETSAQARLAIWRTAWLLDQGHRASNESSMSKVICSEAIARVADRSLQIPESPAISSASRGPYLASEEGCEAVQVRRD